MPCCVASFGSFPPWSWPSPAGGARATKSISIATYVRFFPTICFFCHGPDAEHRQADLRLDVAAAALEYAIVPGEPDASLILERIRSAEAADRMPPPESEKTLSQEEVEVLERWIASGANYAPYWAYQVPANTANPTLPVEWQAWPRHWVDTFVARRLAEEGLEPSPDADPITLVRRVSLDLTGLPPDLEEAAPFLAAPTDTNWAGYVDVLLQSPRFGERMAMWWLDLVRFADTVGYHGDQDHNVWPYRDFVIEAFNRDLPFDVFCRAQLAGDLDPVWDDLDATWQGVATAYHRLLQTSHEGGVQLKEYRAIYMADRVRNFTQVFMAATGGCAQCHDHKYDPITTRDFYALGAFFADIDDEEHLRNPYGGLNSLPTKRVPEQKVEVHGRSGTVLVTQPLPQPRVVRILPRGNWLDESGEVVSPAVPAFLGTLAISDRQATRSDLAYWLFLPSAEGGIGELTARVQVNRLWALLFGHGLARTLDDFGGQGEPPDHPELLDRLALAWVEQGWRVKPLLRELVLSRAYRQSSAPRADAETIDPENRLLARQRRHRLPAEMIRDQALAIGGLLVHRVGGPSVKPYQPERYYAALNFPQRRYQWDDNEEQWRRGVYVHWQRQFLHPMLKAFDAPSREECVALRGQSNVPTQALVLLNDPTFVEAARSFAELCLTEEELASVDDDERLRWAFRRMVQRAPTDQELEILHQQLERHRDHYRQNPSAARALVSVGRAASGNAVNVSEWAAWTNVTRALLNLDEAITRN
jgi:mono/diheme cytochrome c family protein